MALVFIFILSLISVFMTPATCQLSIVSVNAIEDGRPFTITCNAQRVITSQTANFSIVDYLQIDIWNNGADKYTMTAQYKAFGPINVLNGTQNPPDGRNWKFSFSGSNAEDGGRNNQATMKIEILVPAGKCEDAGLYKCTMAYYSSNGAIPASSEQNVTSTATTTEPLVTLDPVYGGIAGVSNTSTYDVGENVTVTCRFEGPEQLGIKWKRERRPAFGIDLQFDDYPITNDITTDTPTRVPGTSATCPQYSHRSVLKLMISSEDNDRRYQCVVMSGEEEQARSAVFIQVNEGNTSPPPLAGAMTKPDNIGLIVGVVVGCVFALIIIIVLIAFFCLRSKQNQKSEDNRATPDGEHSQSIPPPVLYSRPNKAINNNNNSRVSKALDEDGRREPRNRQHDDASYKTKEGKPYRYNPSVSNDAYTHEHKQHNGMSRQNEDNLHYASTDVSRSEDESVEQLVVPPGRNRSNPKPRNLPPIPRPREDNKQLNYIQLDLSKKEGSENAGHRNRSTAVEYAEISV